MDFAKRASDHLHYDIDPIVRSRMDTDFYKILMRQVIASRHPLAQVRIALKNRTRRHPPQVRQVLPTCTAIH